MRWFFPRPRFAPGADATRLFVWSLRKDETEPPWDYAENRPNPPKKWIFDLPTIHFQGLLTSVSFREGKKSCWEFLIPFFFEQPTKAKEETISFPARFVEVSGARGAAAFVPRGFSNNGEGEKPRPVDGRNHAPVWRISYIIHSRWQISCIKQ